jgi:hypothetical protein
MMATYKRRLTDDLDRWVGAGLVPAGSRGPILDSVPDARQLDAATSLAWIGAVLAGAAAIAFIGANWDALPRLLKFALVLALYGGAAGAGAWCAGHGRPRAAEGLLAFAALVFAAAVGLTGQIFDIAGDPRTALYISAVAAGALALAGRSAGAAVVAVVFCGWADIGFDLVDFGRSSDFAAMVVVAPAAAALAWRWRSAGLAHAAGLGFAVAAAWVAARIGHGGWADIGVSACLAAMAVGARWLRERGEACGGVLYGWLTWEALGFFVNAGWEDGHLPALLHRGAWLAIGAGLIVLGRHDRHTAVTVAGVLALIGAISAIMTDLGFGLMTASAVFLGAAVLAGVAGFALRRRTA